MMHNPEQRASASSIYIMTWKDRSSSSSSSSSMSLHVHRDRRHY